MADKALCSIPDCGKQHYAFELCRNHYMRRRRTGQTGTTMTPRGALRAFANSVLTAPPSSACMTWAPSQTAKYLYFSVNRKNIPAHRFVCERMHGPAPGAEFEAAHECGNRYCLNPQHLSWKTSAENILDKHRHGTMLRGSGVGNSKLTELDIPVIRSGITGNLRETAEKYGVTLSTISLIRRHKTWRHI